MKRANALCAALLACLALRAHAHAFLDHVEPPVGATVQTSPAELKLCFTRDLDPARSSATVLDAGGKRVDLGDARVDAENRALLRVSIGALGPGAYTVSWRVVSVDTHGTSGEFGFRVGG